MLVESVILEMRMGKLRIRLVDPHPSDLVFGLKDYDILSDLKTVAKGEQTRDASSDDNDTLSTSFLHLINNRNPDNGSLF